LSAPHTHTHGLPFILSKEEEVIRNEKAEEETPERLYLFFLENVT
jgi:hypothetical protein